MVEENRRNVWQFVDKNLYKIRAKTEEKIEDDGKYEKQILLSLKRQRPREKPCFGDSVLFYMFISATVFNVLAMLSFRGEWLLCLAISRVISIDVDITIGLSG